MDSFTIDHSQLLAIERRKLSDFSAGILRIAGLFLKLFDFSCLVCV